MTLHQLVERERRGLARLTETTIASLLLAGVAVVLAGGVLWLGGARWLELPRPVPFILWGAIVALLAFGARRGRALVKRETTVGGVAQAVEEERNLRAGSLRGVLEVASSGALGRHGAEQMSARLESLGRGALAPARRRRAMRRTALGGTLALAALLGLLTGARAAPDGWSALLHPVKAWTGRLLDGVALEPLPRAVLRGERVTVRVRAPGRRSVELAQRATGGAWRRSAHAVSNGTATIRLDPVDADLALVATDGRALSDTALIRVVERPFIGDVTIRASFPAYLDRRDETIPLGETVRVPRGTSLQFDGQSSTELREVTLRRDAERITLGTDGRRFSGRLVASTSGHYAWAALGSAGPIADVPPALDLEVMPDSAPRVEILAPGRDTLVTDGDTLSLSVLATDDHGLANVVYRRWVVTAQGEAKASFVRQLVGKTEPQWSGESPLVIAGLQPGDAMHVVAVATDGSPWRLSGQSRELVLRLPTLTEQRDAVRANADSAVAQAEAMANAQKQLQQRTADAAKKRQPQGENQGAQKGGQNPMSYESAEQAKQFAKEQRQLTDRMQQLQQAAKQLEQQLKQSGALDSALQERLREAQQLLKDALTPELQEQLRKLEQSADKLSQEDSRKALTNLAEQQRKLREQLDKSVEMLKRAALEGQMQTLKDEAKDLAKRQRDLVDSMRKADTQQEQSEARKQAKELADKARDLSNDVKELQKRLQKEKAESGAERVSEANNKMQESAEQMEQAAREQAGQTSREQQARDSSGRNSREQRQGEEKQGEKSQGGEKAQGGEKSQGGEKAQGGEQQQGAQPSSQAQQQGQKSGEGQGKGGEKSSQDAAKQAAEAMEEAADQLSKAREQQVGEWKKELTGELDRSIQEMLQLARQQDALEQQARSGAPADEMRSQQSALQQGVEKAGQRLSDASRKSSLLSQRSLRMTDDARKKVQDATRQTETARTGQEMASAMREASESLNQAAASLVRDRERTQESNSATGFAEMLKQLQQMSQQQSQLNSAVQDLLPKPGQSLNQQGQSDARQLAKQQREVAAKLQDAADRDESGRAEQMAKEAKQIAAQLEMAQLDQSVLERQQRLFRKMLDAGKLLEEDQREDTGKREAKAWTGTDVFTPPNAAASGKAASRFQPPTWQELRGLTPEERRLVLEYFKKINAERP